MKGWKLVLGVQPQKIAKSARSRSSSKSAVTSPTRIAVGPVGMEVSDALASIEAFKWAASSQAI